MELSPTGDPELCVDVTEVGLDRLARNEQGLRYLGIAEALSGELRHALFGGGQLIDAGAVAVGGPPAGSPQLRPRPLRKDARAAALRDLKPIVQSAACGGPTVRAPQCSAEVR